MKKKMPFILICLLTSAILVACGPSQAERDEQATKIAASISATQTAEAPTPTDTPTNTPTFTSTPTDTPTRTSTPTSTPTPTPEPTPTSTPTPTPTPEPTPTPTPTDTPPPPTPTPSPTMDADPTVYDNFNNPANEGGYDKGLWEPLWSNPSVQFAQQDRVMMITKWGGGGGPQMIARKYKQFSLDRPTFFEAKLMLSPESKTGNVHLALFTELSPNEPWYSECNIGDGEGREVVAECFEGIPLEGIPEEWQYRYWAKEIVPVQSGSWHTVRMEVDPATMTFSYFVDGRPVGSHISHHADRLKEVRFKRLEIGLYVGRAAGPEDVLTGYVDDVRVGPLQ